MVPATPKSMAAVATAMLCRAEVSIRLSARNLAVWAARSSLAKLVPPLLEMPRSASTSPGKPSPATTPLAPRLSLASWIVLPSSETISSRYWLPSWMTLAVMPEIASILASRVARVSVLS